MARYVYRAAYDLVGDAEMMPNGQLPQAHMDAARVWMETGFIHAPLARDPAVLSLIRELHKEEIRKERERCAHEIASVSMPAMLLAAGDMTAGERRTVRAVQGMFVEMLLRGDA